ncbi:MAG TPA: hypothetical protein VLE70_17525 [Anaerolineae bacterium]|jgi:hypothetical protein|nr:hypothetical protein [Anaerolineae bacterium]
MKLYFCLAALSVMIVGLAACSDDEPAAEPVDLNGPALIMFYTDN